MEHLAVGYKERQAEENQEPCTEMGPEMDTRLDRDPETSRKRSEPETSSPTLRDKRVRARTYTTERYQEQGNRKRVRDIAVRTKKPTARAVGVRGTAQETLKETQQDRNSGTPLPEAFSQGNTYQ